MRNRPGARGQGSGAGPGVGVILLGAVLLSGCGLFRRTPPLPPVIIVEPPLFFPALPPAPMPPPADLNPLTAPPPAWTLALDVEPPPRWRPRRVAPAESPAFRPQADLDKPQPQLSPGMSQQQRFAYRGQVQATLGRAARDLAVLSRRSLSANATATRAQAGEYVRQAQEALQQGDLVRAQMLAAKAETLARFLLGQ
ncbi:MAG: hypothetical protein EPN33_05055 [Acidobacteria bacterium]|nr:MAG: hypothetical protein EPN33_05055 [Acidobacteriota bacterium]